MKGPVTQEWVHGISFMQQTVLLTAIRGPDGVAKYHPVKYLLRWLRRCTLLSALDGRVLITPFEEGGGSFTGPSYDLARHGRVNTDSWMHGLVSEYLRSLDELPETEDQLDERLGDDRSGWLARNDEATVS